MPSGIIPIPPRSGPLHRVSSLRSDCDSPRGRCPSCNMPFDKGKKRRVVDSCGHERCFSCLCGNESCPLCRLASSARGSALSLFGSDMASSGGSAGSRNRVKTNGHFTALMQGRQSGAETPTGRSRSTKSARNSVMTQSCPAPQHPPSRSRFFPSPAAFRSSRSSSRAAQQISDDDEPPAPITSSRRSVASRNKTSGGRDPDLQLRLNLLLGSGSGQPGASLPRQRLLHHREEFASLASLEGTGGLSCNTSPVSTLTGSSDNATAVVGGLHEPSSESVGSLLSVSSGASCSIQRRRHSLTGSHPSADDLSTGFCDRRSSVRRSARSDSIQRLPPHPGPPLQGIPAPTTTPNPPPLRPLFFEVPQSEADPLFVGRRWLLRNLLDSVLSDSWKGALILGAPGAGKTALLLQIVEYSCFGRRHAALRTNESSPAPNNSGPEELLELGGLVAGYHFCQADNSSTCLVPEFVHSLAAQLAQAPRLAAYRELLLGEAHIQSWVSMRECVAAPERALCRGILEPLASLAQQGKISGQPCLLLVDALGEAEYHRPDHGDALSAFLSRHVAHFPPWLKLVATVRSHLQEVAHQLPLQRISLDRLHANENLERDILEYIQFRVKNSPSIQNNVSSPSGSLTGSLSGSTSLEHAGLSRFSQHLAGLAKGCFLFAKLTLDLVETGQLVAKAAGYRVLPTSLHQLFLLRCNLRFPTASAFERAHPLLAVSLASLYPLTLLEIYHSTASLQLEPESWTDFLDRFKLLSGFLVKRMDNTYMFFHPSFREWLMRREDGDTEKFLCDLRLGHAGVALRLSRVQAPLDPERTLELAHHALKAHLFKGCTEMPSRDLQALWLLHSSQSVSAALAGPRNVHAPNLKVSRLLLLAGADPDARTEILGGAPALCAASHLGLDTVASLLLEFGAEPARTDSRGAGPLALAAAAGHQNVCEILLALPGSENLPGRADDAGRCALVHAALGGHAMAARTLLGAAWGPEETSKSANGQVCRTEATHQALVAAASQGHSELVQLLLENGAPLDRADSLLGETALSAASAGGHLPACEVLLQRGASLIAPNAKGVSALGSACKEGQWASARLLLSRGAPPEQADPLGRTPLMLAAAEGHLALVELLLDKGAGAGRGDREGVSALGHACQRGRLVVARVLLERGADVNAADKNGRTALDMAACQGNPEIVQLLLEKGALVEHVDSSGQRPLDRAIACRNPQVVQCFLRRRACLGPATWSAAHGKPEIELLLLGRLLEDGNALYKKGRLREAAGRYLYALRKAPEAPCFLQIRLQLLLNLSRCSRKMNDCEEACRLAEAALALRPDSFEALFARARARMDAGRAGDALDDVNRALNLAPPSNREARRVLIRLRDEVRAQLQSALD